LNVLEVPILYRNVDDDCIRGYHTGGCVLVVDVLSFLPFAGSGSLSFHRSCFVGTFLVFRLPYHIPPSTCQQRRASTYLDMKHSTHHQVSSKTTSNGTNTTQSIPSPSPPSSTIPNSTQKHPSYPPIRTPNLLSSTHIFYSTPLYFCK
jgi:hypothetical protein